MFGVLRGVIEFETSPPSGSTGAQLTWPDIIVGISGGGWTALSPVYGTGYDGPLERLDKYAPFGKNMLGITKDWATDFNTKLSNSEDATLTYVDAEINKQFPLGTKPMLLDLAKSLSLTNAIGFWKLWSSRATAAVGVDPTKPMRWCTEEKDFEESETWWKDLRGGGQKPPPEGGFCQSRGAP